MCPVRCIVRNIIHLRLNNALSNTRLTLSHTADGNTFKLKISNVTESLKQAMTFLGPTLGFLASEISALPLLTFGANESLCGGVDTDVIRLLGRCLSD